MFQPDGNSFFNGLVCCERVVLRGVLFSVTGVIPEPPFFFTGVRHSLVSGWSKR